jgi:hypothetical protein
MIALLLALVALVVKLVLLPFKLALAAMSAGFALATLPFKVAWKSTRMVGLKATTLFLVGAAAGLAFAPGPGRELRRKVMAMAAGAGGVDDEALGEKVRFELAHAPRTWHLPQPDVQVQGGRVVLDGAVPHDTARDELAKIASGVPGVSAVENNLVVDDTIDEPAPAE